MPEHTPGPWKTDDGDTDAIGIFAEDCDAVCYLSENVMNGLGLRGREQDEANARLIAAAPQLLETVRVIRAMCMEFSDDGPGVGRADAADEILRRIAEHAAIAIAATHAPISFDAAEKGVEG